MINLFTAWPLKSFCWRYQVQITLINKFRKWHTQAPQKFPGIQHQQSFLQLEVPAKNINNIQNLALSKEFQLVLMPWSDIPLLHVEKKSRHNQHKKFDITKENCLKVVIVQSHFWSILWFWFTHLIFIK